MKKMLLATVLAFGSLGAACSCATAAEKVFALVPKALGNPFFEYSEKGCKDEAPKLGAECLFTGPSQLDDAEQARIVRDLITKKVAGIAISPNNADSITSVVNAAIAKGIPVIAFDSDAPKSKRAAFIGTNNEAAGAAGGQAFAQALPNGGTYAVITGGLSAANLNDRIKGFKSKLGDNFKEIAGSPFVCNDDTSVGVQLVQDILAKNPKLDGIFVSGGWPLMAPDAYQKALKNKVADIKDGKFAVVAFDTLPAEVRNLKEGYVTALVGQKPFMMGVEAMKQLEMLSKGEQVPPVTDTGVELVDKTNVDKFAAAQ